MSTVSSFGSWVEEANTVAWQHLFSMKDPPFLVEELERPPTSVPEYEHTSISPFMGQGGGICRRQSSSSGYRVGIVNALRFPSQISAMVRAKKYLGSRQKGR